METVDLIVDIISILLYIYVGVLLSKKLGKSTNKEKVLYVIIILTVLFLLARKMMHYIG